MAAPRSAWSTASCARTSRPAPRRDRRRGRLHRSRPVRALERTGPADRRIARPGGGVLTRQPRGRPLHPPHLPPRACGTHESRRAMTDERATIGVPRERAPGERRVALVPDTVQRLVSSGLRLIVEPGAGAGARISDSAFAAAGAELGDEAWSADVVVKFSPPTLDEGGPSAARIGADRTAATRDVTRARGGVERAGRQRVRARVGAAHQPCAVDGRPQLAGDRRGLSRGAAGGRAPHALRTDADDGRGNRAPGARARDGRGRRRAPGACGRTAPRSSHDRLRRPPGCRRRGPIGRRQMARDRRRRGDR